MFIAELPSPLQAEITFINLYDEGFCSPLPMTNPSGHKVYCSAGSSSLVPGVLLKFFLSVRESEPRLVFALHDSVSRGENFQEKTSGTREQHYSPSDSYFTGGDR